MSSYHRTRAISVRDTWAKRCDDYVFVSNKSDADLHAIAIVEKDRYETLWNKTSSALQYLNQTYGTKFDYFLKADDGTYVVMENLWKELEKFDPESPVLIGKKHKRFFSGGYVSGGAGYVLSKAALHRLVEGLERQKLCTNSDFDHSEDVKITACAYAMKVSAFESIGPNGMSRFNYQSPFETPFEKVKVITTSANTPYYTNLPLSTALIKPSVLPPVQFDKPIGTRAIQPRPVAPDSALQSDSSNALNNSPPPVISSDPPLFEPPPLPRTLACPLINSQDISPSIAPYRPGAPTVSCGSSAFPSPGSAFTELQPRNLNRTVGVGQPAQQHQQLSRSTTDSQPLITSKPTGSGRSSSASHCSSSRSSARSPSHPSHADALSTSLSSSGSVAAAASGVMYCVICGQSHNLNAPHRYGYTQSVDADLCCMLCRLPLVDPLDTKCGHTFCTPCLKNHLAVQALCPVDRQIINYLECQQASKIVKRLLDKLLVSCPNSQYCNSIENRCSLEGHLRDWCAGTIAPCESATSRGCLFVGPRASHAAHRLQCPTACSRPQPMVPFVSERSTAACRIRHNGASGRMASCFTPRLPTSQLSPFQPVVATTNTTDQRMKSEAKAWLPEINETYDSPRIVEGTPVSIVIQRPAHCSELGFTFVGGVDTPLPCILIQEIYLDGAVASDGRLRPGDQILEINAHVVTNATHSEAQRQFTSPAQLIQLSVFREAVDWNPRPAPTPSQPQEEVFLVRLCKRRSQVLGIKLVGKKSIPGLYVLELVPGCEAEIDGRLHENDQILEINGIDLSDGTQEQAAHIINTAAEFVTFKVRRRNRADTPDILRVSGEPSDQADMSPLLLLKNLRTTETTPRRTGPTGRSSVGELNAATGAVSMSVAQHPHRTRSVQSGIERSSGAPCGDSHQTETSSLRASRTPSSLSDGENMTNSTAQLLVDDDGHNAASTTGEHMSRPLLASSTAASSPAPSTDKEDLDPRTTASPICAERTIVVDKSPDEPMGITVAGGRHSQRGDTPIYVTNISREGVLGKTDAVKRGDVLLEVNGVGLVGLSHAEAVDTLRRVGLTQTRIQLRLIDAPEMADGQPINFMPSWTFWLKLPPVCQLTRVVQLRRDPSEASPSGWEPLGFSILGGLDTSLNTPERSEVVTAENRLKVGYASLYPGLIVIKSIVPGLLAQRDGRLKCGDLILSVNNASMLNTTHAVAVRTLKRLRGDVELRIISWPGTIV